MKNFEGKVALVTGGSSGLGEATALKFAEEGAKVVIAARRAEQSARVVQRIADSGGEAHFVQADVSRGADVEHMVREAVKKYGRLDCAVNNAGISGPRLTPMADITEAQWDEVMGVNLKGVWLCIKHEIPAMLANGSGAIVNVASIYGSKPSDMGHCDLRGQQAWCRRSHQVRGRRLWADEHSHQRGGARLHAFGNGGSQSARRRGTLPVAAGAPLGDEPLRESGGDGECHRLAVLGSGEFRQRSGARGRRRGHHAPLLAASRDPRGFIDLHQFRPPKDIHSRVNEC
jgi:NAD(P)-dependent dehydrogenase (short-subunit alcohol dehydrogenase family)